MPATVLGTVVQLQYGPVGVAVGGDDAVAVSVLERDPGQEPLPWHRPHRLHNPVRERHRRPQRVNHRGAQSAGLVWSAALAVTMASHYRAGSAVRGVAVQCAKAPQRRPGLAIRPDWLFAQINQKSAIGAYGSHHPRQPSNHR